MLDDDDMEPTPMTKGEFLFLLAVFAVVVAVALFWRTPAHASASDCNMIQNDELRHICYARTLHSESECNLVGDSDTRAYCRALATGRH